MRFDESCTENRGLVRYLKNANRVPPFPDPVTLPENHPDPYWKSGNHPEIVERIWDYFGSSFPGDCKVLVYGAPALVHPDCGVVFALAIGTSYALRIPENSMAAAVVAGCQTENQWSDGNTTNLEKEFGRGWVFGGWRDEEKQWLLSTYEALSKSE